MYAKSSSCSSTNAARCLAVIAAVRIALDVVVVPDADGFHGAQRAAQPDRGRATGGDVEVGPAELHHLGESAVEQA